MKPIYKSLALANMALAVTLSLQANVTSDGASTPQAVNAETLEGLKVTLVSPNVSGARDLIASGECVINNDKLQISLDGSKLAQGTTHRILVQMEYGTNTVVLYALNITVPRYVTLASGTQAYADNVVVVSTFGDGADVPVVIDTEITENSQNPVTSAAIYAGLAGRQPAGTYADGTTYTKSEGTPATIVGKVIMGRYNVADEQDEYALIVGNGTDAEHLSNAFAIDKTGNLVLFNSGAAVVLTPAKLAQLIA